MVELKPGQQEGSDVKYTLTSQIIHNIFTEFPSGKEEKFFVLANDLSSISSEESLRPERSRQGIKRLQVILLS